MAYRSIQQQRHFKGTRWKTKARSIKMKSNKLIAQMKKVQLW